jgi:hypothetical protein
MCLMTPALEAVTVTVADWVMAVPLASVALAV